MEEQLVLLMDILGFGHAVETWVPEKLARLIELLHDLASLRSESEREEIRSDEGGAATWITPATTTFSDHIVISYRTAHLHGGSLGLGLSLLRSTVGEFAAAAARLGLLIRGGVAIGPLHHRDGVVVGVAMNEAHRLESQVANYPRIIISREVISRTNPQVRGELFLTGDDGHTHLDYFATMLISDSDSFDPRGIPQLRERYEDLQQIAEENIKHFTQKKNCESELGKWEWFKTHLYRTRSGLPREFFN